MIPLLAPILALVLHAVLLAVAVPVLSGLRAQAAARWRGAEGPALDQALHDLVRLWRKGTVLPAGASFLFAAAPILSLALAATAAVLVPSFALGLATAPVADLVVAGVLLAASRGVLLAAAWDAGTALAVHEAKRTLVSRIGAAPVLLLAGFAVLALCGSTNLEAAAAAVRDGGPGVRLAGVLAGAALFTAALDGPAPGGGSWGASSWGGGPWSGRLRALAVLAGDVRALAALNLAAAIGCPFGLSAAPEGWLVGLACWALKLGVLGLLATAIGPLVGRLALPAASVLALMAAVAAGLQGTA